MNITKRTNKFFVTLIIFACSINSLLAQWAIDPTSNTRLVTNPVDPINISAVKDLEGGAYIFWQDTKGVSKSNVYFIHIDPNGNSSIRSDGKAITTNNNVKNNPVAISDPEGNSMVMWRELDKKKVANLFIQKVTKNGLRLWGTDGLKITDSKYEKIDYALGADKKGYCLVSYVTKTYQIPNKYFVRYQKIDPNGRAVDDSSTGVVYSANNIISETNILPDNKGDFYVFWLENINQKTVLRAQFIDSIGTKKWRNKPLTISKENSTVINYATGRVDNNIYVVITYQGVKKTVNQQLVSDSGIKLWGSEGKNLTYQPGSHTNPQFVIVDSTVVVSWTNEYDKVKDVLIQRFDNKGNPLWGINGKKVINIIGNQFGQKLLYDGKEGVIIAWIDKRENGSFAELSIQKIDSKGDFVWNTEGVKISSSQNMQKSYLDLVPDEEGGAIAIFKGSADGRNDIYGQKIFSTGTYSSQILGFSSEVIGDSVKINWYAANEADSTTYSIQRSEQTNETENDWKTIGTLRIENKKQANYYEYYDRPDVSGSIFYRIVQNINDNETQVSMTSKIDYFNNVESVVLAQNEPNPFSDSTTITFYLPKDEQITLEIFNSNIETIKKIEDQEYPAGKNYFVFNSQGLEPGVYYYRLKVADFVDVKKMVITN
jgi:hypothetical protein